MMLVISVIVALAILGVLLNILGGINFGVGNPTDVMKDNLKGVYSKGYSAGTPAKKSTFDQGNIITAKDVIGDLPLDSANVKFNCPTSDSSVCGSGTTKIVASPHAITSGSNQNLRIYSKVEAYIVVCGDSNKAAPPQYCIGLGSTAQKAVDACGKTGTTGSCGLFS
jgi:hypothetical protein